MPTKACKTLTKYIESVGYEYTRTNSKGFEAFQHPMHGELLINPSISDSTAQNVKRNVQKALGMETPGDRSKRNANNVKERQAAERERLAEQIARHQREIDDLVRQLEARMDGLGAVLTEGEMRRIERLVEQRERELRGWQRLMTEIPTNNDHVGRTKARHRS